MRKCRGQLQATRGVENFHSSLPHWAYLFHTSFIWRISPSSLLDLVRHDLGSILGMLILTWCDESNDSTTSDENINSAGSCENGFYPHPSIRSYSGAENQSGSTNDLVLRLAGEFWAPLWGFTCGINVSVQHYTPCYPSLLIFLCKIKLPIFELIKWCFKTLSISKTNSLGKFY